MKTQQMEGFLEEAFKNITPPPALAKVGSVEIEPDYDEAIVDYESSALASELKSCLDAAAPLAAVSPQGVDIPLPADKPVLKKYIRTITLSETRHKPWVRVLPYGGPL